jgi:hypothetical protein
VPSVPPEDQAFWYAYQHELVSRLTKEDLRAMYRLGIDLVECFRFTPGDLASWPGRILILESDEDLPTPEQRAELRRCYPRAGIYISVIKEFLHQ